VGPLTSNFTFEFTRTHEKFRCAAMLCAHRSVRHYRGACAHRHAQLPRDTLRVAPGAGCHLQTSGCLNCRRRMAMNEALRHAPCTPKLHHLK
jgi:hypothetical protein